jgi:hypothetical protein
VRAYLLAPPANAAALLDADARLRRKLAAAERVIGAGFQVMPALGAHALSSTRDARVSSDAVSASATAAGAFMERLERWRRPALPRARLPGRCIVVAVDAQTIGWLATLNDGRVISTLDGRTGELLPIARLLAELAEGHSRALEPDEARTALAALHAWFDAEQLATICGIAGSPGPLRRIVIDWLTLCVRSLRRHEHAVALPLIARLRDSLRVPLPLGAERLMAEHAFRSRDGNRDAIATLIEALRIVDETVQFRTSDDHPRQRPEPVALILFGKLSS